ncbi:MAG: glycosyltransferase [Velocimicrobium sp.]
MKWCILLGSPAISGGTYVIFEHALRALDSGISVTIVTEAKVDKSELQWYKGAEKLEWKTYEEVKDRVFNVLIATWWRTVYEAYRINAKHYVYFVQSIESKFYDANELPIVQLVEATYMLPFTIITEATWIKDYLYEKYNKVAYLAHNGIRKDIYTEQGQCIAPINPEKLRVLVEGPVNVGFKNIPKTIELCKASKADEIWLMTSSNLNQYDGVDRVFSRVPIFKTPEIYRSCDVIVKLSYVEGMFGPPLEMFHCGGTTITYNVTGHDEYIVHDYNGFVVKTDDDQKVIEYINQLKDDSDCLVRLKDGAQKTAASWNGWDEAAKKFRDIIVEICNGKEECQKVIDDESKFHFRSYVIAEDYLNELKAMKQTQISKKMLFRLKSKFPHQWKRKLKKSKIVIKIWSIINGY